MRRQAILWFVGFTGALSSRPSVQPYLGLHGLHAGKVSNDGRRSTLDFEHVHPTGKKVKVHYDAELAEGLNVFNLDQEEAVESVTCSTGKVRIHFTDSSALQHWLALSTSSRLVVTASHLWGCASPETGKPESIMRHAQNGTVDGSVLSFQTEPAQFVELFRNLHVSSEVSAFPHTEEMQKNTRAENMRNDALSRRLSDRIDHHRRASADVGLTETAQQRSKVGGFFDFLAGVVRGIAHVFKAVVDAVVSVIHTLIDVAKAVADIVRLAVTGDMEWNKNWDLVSVQWNWNGAGAERTDIPIWPRGEHLSDELFDEPIHVRCTDCYLHFGISMHLLINITDYEVHQFGSWLQGDLNARLHASLVSVHPQLHPSETQVISNVPYQLPEISLPTFTFPVLAIPLTIHPVLENELGFDIGIGQLNSPSIGLRANVDGALKLGVMYRGDSGWGAINEKTWDHSLDFVGPAFQTSVSFTPYIMPKVVFVIEHIGGPSFGVKIGLESQLTWDAASSTCPLLPRPPELPAAVPTGGAFGKLDLTFQFSLGAQLKVEFFGRTLMEKRYEPDMPEALRVPILSGCLLSMMDGNEPSVVEVPSLLPEGAQPLSSGVTFSGALVPKRQFSNLAASAKCANSPPISSSMQMLDSVDPHNLQHQMSLHSQLGEQRSFLNAHSAMWDPEDFMETDGCMYYTCEAESGESCECSAESGECHCPRSELPAEVPSALEVQSEEGPDKSYPDESTDEDCSQKCARNGYSTEGARVVGTAPLCHGDASDCALLGMVSVGIIHSGNGCWSGNKYCCCAEAPAGDSLCEQTQPTAPPETCAIPVGPHGHGMAESHCMPVTYNFTNKSAPAVEGEFSCGLTCTLDRHESSYWKVTTSSAGCNTANVETVEELSAHSARECRERAPPPESQGFIFSHGTCAYLKGDWRTLQADYCTDDHFELYQPDSYWCDWNCGHCTKDEGVTGDGSRVEGNQCVPRDFLGMKQGSCQGVWGKVTHQRRQFEVSVGSVTVGADGDMVADAEDHHCEDNADAREDVNDPCYTWFKSVAKGQAPGQGVPQLKITQSSLSGISLDAGECYEPATFTRRDPNAAQWVVQGDCSEKCNDDGSSCGSFCSGAVNGAHQPGQAGCTMVGGLDQVSFSDCRSLAAGKDLCQELNDEHQFTTQEMEICERMAADCKSDGTCNVMDVLMGFPAPAGDHYCRLWSCTGISQGILPDQDGDQAWLYFWLRNNTEVPSAMKCSDCEANGYLADECGCGYCGSFGSCTWSCGTTNEAPPRGPQCIHESPPFEIVI